MRRVIGFVTSRYGLAGLAALAVIVVVVAGRLAGIGTGDSDGGSGVPAADGGQAGTTSISPVPNDAPTASPTRPDPVVSPGQHGPLTVATTFATAFLDTDRSADAWRKALRAHASPRLTDELSTMDPATVPAGRLTGRAKLGDHGATWAEVRLPTRSGTLVFRLVSAHGVWQVDRLDWDRQR